MPPSGPPTGRVYAREEGRPGAALFAEAMFPRLIAGKVHCPDALRVRRRIEHPRALLRDPDTGRNSVRRVDLEVHYLEAGQAGRDVPVALVVAVVPEDTEVRPDVELAGLVVADDVAHRQVATV